MVPLFFTANIDRLLISILFPTSLVVALWAVALRRRSLKMPPGPRGGFLSGVRSKMPTQEPWKTYAAWSQEYGDSVVSFRVHNRYIVVLNSREDISELLEKRSDIYSDRPMSWMYNVICNRGDAIFNISSSEPRHKQYRKILQSGLGIRATREYVPLIHREAQRLARGLLHSPRELITHVQRNTAAVVMKVAFGYTIEDNDPFIKLAEETSKISGSALQPGRWLVDHYPMMRFIPWWFPGARWKRQGLLWRERLRYLTEIPHEWVKQEMEASRHVDSFTSKLLCPEGGKSCTPEEEEAIKWCSSGLYAGAGDTTVSAIISFILLMALHPNVQSKARTEIRATFGVLNWRRDADPPSGADSGGKRTDVSIGILDDAVDLGRVSQMQYLNAIMKEVLRFAPVGNLALPHCLVTEDVYRGYRIPKNATVLGNVWAVLHDPSIYPEPFAFSPERFLQSVSNSGMSTIQPDPRQWAFGFGKRACPGSHFAETTVLFAMFNILAMCDIHLPKGALKPTLEFTTGITSHIKPFPIEVDPLL